MVHQCVINLVVMWLHMCILVDLLLNSATYTHQQGPTNICSHITTELIAHQCTIIGYFNKGNFSKHE